MSDFGGFNFSDLPRFDLGLANTARQAAEISAAMDDIADYNRKKDEALFETAEASRAQKELLERQLEEVKEQNNLLKENNAALKENYSTLKELYEMTRAEAESSANEAKQNKFFGWVSFAVGTIIGIAGIVIGIIL